MRIIILGPTGSGKSTQAKFIAKALKISHIVSSKLLIQESKKNKLIKDLLNKGKLVPDKLVIRIVNKRIKNKKNFILDGFPRTMVQVKSMKFKPDLVIYLKTSKNVIVKRLLLRKRFDDTKKSIEQKYKIYLKQTLPVINYYKRKKLLITINGNPKIKQVSNNIKKVIKRKFK